MSGSHEGNKNERKSFGKFNLKARIIRPRHA
jgi:hypothetical protein